MNYLLVIYSFQKTAVSPTYLSFFFASLAAILIMYKQSLILALNSAALAVVVYVEFSLNNAFAYQSGEVC